MYYSGANYIDFKRLSDEKRTNNPYISHGYVKAAYLYWKVRMFSNVKPSVQFTVGMTTDDLVEVDKKTQFQILDIFERDNVNNRTQEIISDVNKKKTKKNDSPRANRDPFGSDSDYDTEPLKLIKKTYEYRT